MVEEEARLAAGNDEARRSSRTPLPLAVVVRGICEGRRIHRAVRVLARARGQWGA